MINNRSQGFSKIFTILIVLMPLLGVYAFPGIPALTLGEPLLLACAIFLLLNSVYKGKITTNSPQYFIFVAYIIVVSLLNTLIISEYSITDTMAALLRLFFYTTVIFILANEYIDFTLLRRAYLFVCFVSALYLIIQFVFGTFFNIFLPSTFSNLKVMYSNYTGNDYNTFLFGSYRSLIFRPSSFFKEPSHLSRYLVYVLPIIAYKKVEKSVYETIVFILVIAAILINQSAMGFLSVGVFLVMWVFSNRRKYNLLNRAGIILIAISLVLLSINAGLLDQALGRLSVETGSGGARLYRGFAIFSSMKPGFKLFGSGLGNYSAFASHYSISTVYDAVGNSGNDYMNLISRTLVSSGIVGFIIYIYSLLKLVWKKSNVQIACFTLFIFFAFGSDINYYSAEYILPMLFMVFDINTISDSYKQSVSPESCL